MKKLWLFVLIIHLSSSSIYAREHASFDDLTSKIQSCFGDKAAEFFTRNTINNQNPMTGIVNKFYPVENEVIQTVSNIISMGSQTEILVRSEHFKEIEKQVGSPKLVGFPAVLMCSDVFKNSDLNGQQIPTVADGVLTFLTLYYMDDYENQKSKKKKSYEKTDVAKLINEVRDNLMIRKFNEKDWEVILKHTHTTAANK